MIIEGIINKIPKDEGEELIGGLIFGLFFGLIGGLIVGLIFGLIVGLIFGLIVGLIFGLIGGLIGDLIGGLGYLLSFFTFLGLASLISHHPHFLPLWLFFLMGIVLVELFFWLDTQKPKRKQSKFWFVCLKKLEALGETIFVLGIQNLGRLVINKLRIFDKWEIILKWIGYIGAGLIGLIIIIGILYLYIKLNSLKYKK